MILISFLDEVSNFRNRTLTNQKHELVVSNCERNCMLKATGRDKTETVRKSGYTRLSEAKGSYNLC